MMFVGKDDVQRLSNGAEMSLLAPEIADASMERIAQRIAVKAIKERGKGVTHLHGELYQAGLYHAMMVIIADLKLDPIEVGDAILRASEESRKEKV